MPILNDVNEMAKMIYFSGAENFFGRNYFTGKIEENQHFKFKLQTYCIFSKNTRNRIAKIDNTEI